MMTITFSKLKSFFSKSDSIRLQYTQQFQLAGTNVTVVVRTYQHPMATNQLVTMIECNTTGVYREKHDYAFHVGFRSVWGVTEKNLKEENAKGVLALRGLDRSIYSFYNCGEV